MHGSAVKGDGAAAAVGGAGVYHVRGAVRVALGPVQGTGVEGYAVYGQGVQRSALRGAGRYGAAAAHGDVTGDDAVAAQGAAAADGHRAVDLPEYFQVAACDAGVAGGVVAVDQEEAAAHITVVYALAAVDQQGAAFYRDVSGKAGLVCQRGGTGDLANQAVAAAAHEWRIKGVAAAGVGVVEDDGAVARAKLDVQDVQDTSALCSLAYRCTDVDGAAAAGFICQVQRA
ncbi:hypothetical protein CUZ56_02687 [Saezia sanguinis]|uniref:Uncharacterized protein n=1 Tax=Saezia sanguinis TaxID=1965230 RepID=A0A433SAU1_9BURK|nr:hypothetical protein CUZ56_02687 [Saezia sanguinis]